MVRLRCRAYAAEIDFVVDYQAWVVANFSGILCVDEVYQGDLALLWPSIPPRPMVIGWSATPCCQGRTKSTKVWSGRSSIVCEQPVSILTRSLRTTRGCTQKY